MFKSIVFFCLPALAMIAIFYFSGFVSAGGDGQEIARGLGAFILTALAGFAGIWAMNKYTK